MKKKLYRPIVPDVSVMENGSVITVLKKPLEEAVTNYKNNVASSHPIYKADGFKQCAESNDNYKSIIIAGPNLELCETCIVHLEEYKECLDSKVNTDKSGGIWQEFVSEKSDEDNDFQIITVLKCSDVEKKSSPTGIELFNPKIFKNVHDENSILGINYSIDKLSDKEDICRYIKTMPECKELYSIVDYGNYKGNKKELQLALTTLALQTDSEIIFINMTKEQMMEYYRNLFITILENHGVDTKGSIDVDRIIAVSQKLNQARPGFMLEKLLKRVFREKSGNAKICNEDFAFIEDLVKQSEEDSLGTNTEVKRNYGLIGQENAVSNLNCICKSLSLNKMRADKGMDNPDIHNIFVFEGPPGTGKTTATKQLAIKLHDIGVIKDSNYIQVNGAELKGEYQGQSIPKVKKIFAENSVILIDEAYSLVAGDGKDLFGNEVMSQLLIEVENLQSDKVVIFAGYGGEDVEDKDNFMKKFIEANPGLSSRISNVVYFEPYDEETMVEICHKLAEASNYILESESDEIIKSHFAERIGSSNFGNGREARRLVENAIRAMADRIVPDDNKKSADNLISEDDLKTILACDIEKAIEQECKINNCTKSKKKTVGFV